MSTCGNIIFCSMAVCEGMDMGMYVHTCVYASMCERVCVCTHACVRACVCVHELLVTYTYRLGLTEIDRSV